MDTLLAFLLTLILTLFLVRRYLRRLVPKYASGDHSTPPPLSSPAISCPRCATSILGKSSFCHACGAPLALWNVHRAEVQTAPQSSSAREKGKPRPVINASLCIGCASCVDSCPETGTLELLGGKAILAHPERCVGHARCVEACPTSAIALTYGVQLRTLRAPVVKEDFETNIDGIYIVGELCGLGLIKTAINEGRMAVDSIQRKLEADGVWTPPAFDPGPDEGMGSYTRTAADQPYDVVIVGAGPAGLSASLTALQHGLRYVTLEQGQVADTIRNYPRHKFLMAEPVEMPLFGNLYVGDGTKESLLQVWEAILANTGVQIRTQERVESICRRGSLLRVESSEGAYLARSVVLALGKRGSPRKLNVPGEELAKVTYGLIEAGSYQNKDLLVVGGGDSAVEAALALSKASRNRVTLSYRGETFDRVKERNRNMLLIAEEQGRIRTLRGSNVLEISSESVRLETGGGEIRLPNHYVFVLIGGDPSEGFLRRIGVEIVEKVIGSQNLYESLV